LAREHERSNLQPVKERAIADMTIEEVMRSIDVLGRLAFAGQCVAAMALLAGPLLFITCAIVPWFLWDDNRGEAIGTWLGGWALAAAITGAGAALAVFCWRWSGDWITEWPGYATGFGIAGVALAVQAYLMTSTPIPIPASFAITIGAAFAAGFLVAGNLAGTRVLDATRQQGRAVVRRR
jgi:hypothetical protein